MDIKDPKELEKLVKFCRKQGITSLKSGDFEISFATSALFPESEYKKKKQEDGLPLVDDSAFSETDALFWSSAGIPDEVQ